MKKIFFLILVVQLISCEKVKFTPDCDDSSICHLVIQGKPDTNRITGTFLDTIKALFNANNISLNNLYLYWYQRDDLGYFHIACLQYINNLNVLSDEVIFHFNQQGYYTSLSGEIISDIKVSSVPSLCIGHVVDLFLQNVENDGFYSRDLQKIKDGCISCELCYWDLNSGVSYAEKKFTLAWRVKPLNSDYPWALINDTKNSPIFYDNGIRTWLP